MSGFVTAWILWAPSRLYGVATIAAGDLPEAMMKEAGQKKIVAVTVAE
jgi:hypothetical protein